ncbi:DUF6035 family protein [Sphingobacterium sp. LRF_L2]|uniref:DUF6035 family protein n=1 Tax=Sphingobacterium sp. LRF_L2 TaxID=3369421 RepID=UPI003F5FC08A
MDRSIQYANDSQEGGVIDIETVVTSQKEGFGLRDDYNSNLERYTCVECGQRLIVAHSSLEKVYFRHLPNSEDCILKDSSIDPDILFGLRTVAFAREGARHIFLKNRIGEVLKSTEGIDPESIDIDSKFIFGSGGAKRRPDVFCEFQGLKIAFEIQISYLPLHYIKHRYAFYRKNGIFLIWIIDFDNNPKDLDTFQRDIKYIWEHQNLYRINDAQDKNLKLACHYKQPFIHENKEVREKWTVKEVLLDDLKFSQDDYSCYYMHNKNETVLAENQLKQFKAKIALDKLEQEIAAKRIARSLEVRSLLEKIKKWRKLDYSFYKIINEVNGLSYDCVELMNKEINLDRFSGGVPLLLVFIKEYKPLNSDDKVTVVEFLLSCLELKFDVKATDSEGNGVIQYLYNNPALSRYLYRLTPHLFQRGYKVTENDRVYLIDLLGKEGQVLYYELSYYSACDTAEEIKLMQFMLRFFLFVQSAKEMEIIGSNVKSWVAYIVPILSRYTELWTYIKLVLERTSLGAELQRVDKKGTINRKKTEFSLGEIECDEEKHNLICKIYPEIFMY